MSSEVDWTAVLKVLFGAAGLGGMLSLVVYLVLLVAKSALVEAVKLAGQKEIEARKTELAKDLEDHKKKLSMEVEARKSELATQLEVFKKGLTLEIEQTKAAAQRELAHELERARAAAARELEQYKSELTLASETRRQVAALKVKALLEFVKVLQGFYRDAFNVAWNVPEQRALITAKLRECYEKSQEIEPLLDNATWVKISDTITKISTEARRWDKPGHETALTRARDELKETIRIVRSELALAEEVADRVGVVPTTP